MQGFSMSCKAAECYFIVLGKRHHLYVVPKPVCIFKLPMLLALTHPHTSSDAVFINCVLVTIWMDPFLLYFSLEDMPSSTFCQSISARLRPREVSAVL